MICYKIRSKNDPSQFLKGTPVYHTYDKTGRIFHSLGALRTFLTGIINNEYRKNNIGDWDIVEMELCEVAVKQVHEIIKPEKLIKLLKQ